jgi:hypothetical protein
MRRRNTVRICVYGHARSGACVIAATLFVNQTYHQIERLMILDGETIGGASVIAVEDKFKTDLFEIVFTNPSYYFTCSLAFGPSVILR